MAGSVITQGSYGFDYTTLVRHWFFDKEKSLDPLYTRLFDEVTTKDRFTHDTVFGGLGLAQIKPEGEPFRYDSLQQGKEKVYTQAVYATGAIMTMESEMFAQAKIVAKNLAGEMRKALYEKKEELLADDIDNAFSASNPGFDGKAMCAIDHPIQDGKTIRNELSVGTALSEAALEQAMIDMKAEMKDYRGKRSTIKSDFLVVPTALSFDAERILRNNVRPLTADRDIHALNQLGFLKGEIMHHHRLSDADNWFIKNEVQDGLKLIKSKEVNVASDGDFDTYNKKFTAHEIYGHGFTDYRVLFGSEV